MKTFLPLFLYIFSVKVIMCLMESEDENLKKFSFGADKADREKFSSNAHREDDKNGDTRDFSKATQNGNNLIENHFSSTLISTIQQAITALLSPSNPQIIPFLLTLFPVFPPAAVVGGFLMVILSILQNPSLLYFMQKLLSNLNPLSAMNFAKGSSLSRNIFNRKEPESNDMLFQMIKEGETFNSKLAAAATKKMKLINLRHSVSQSTED